jgi:DNA polymerase
MDSRQSDILDIMEITRWVPRNGESVHFLSAAQQNLVDQAVVQSDELPLETNTELPQVVSLNEVGWEQLEEAVSTCELCGLHEKRTQTVFGTGDQQANWLIIGEAPGEQEDVQGEPFVGRAGVLLNNILASVGLDRTRVYIANVVKCRPPRNRDPLSDELETCYPYLQRQIDLIQPKLILLIGRVAAQTLLKTDTAVGRLRGKVHHMDGSSIPMIVTYHPAYLLRRPSEKQKVWKDLLLAKETVAI